MQPGQSHIYIRGVVNGGDGNHSGLAAPGRHLPRRAAGHDHRRHPGVHLYDIQRIEVLEGPQGTLYGASSEAGTVRIITNKPDTSKFYGNVTVEGNQIAARRRGLGGRGLRQHSAVARLRAVRLVGWAEHDGGYIDNVQGTDKNACIVNGVRTFPTWDGQPYQAPLTPCPAPGVVGAGAITNAPWAKNNFNTVDTYGGRAAMKVQIGRQLDGLTDAHGAAGQDRGLLRLRPRHRRPAGSRLRAGCHHRFLVHGRLDGRGQGQRLRHHLCRRLHEAHQPHAGGVQRLLAVLRSRLRLGRLLDRQQRQTGYAAGVRDRGQRHFQKWSQELRVSTPAYFPAPPSVASCSASCTTSTSSTRCRVTARTHTAR